MKYRIEEKENGLVVCVDEVKDKKVELLQAFHECQEGRCTCPTEEYKKLESLEIDHTDDAIALRLTAKDGKKISKDEINTCLEYTAEQVARMK